jgi:GNAT superfamily N-acetyltransferase
LRCHFHRWTVVAATVAHGGMMLQTLDAPRFFSSDYVEHAVLRSGMKVRLRLVRPGDTELLRAGFDRLSPASRYARFLAPKLSLSDDELRYLCDVDQENHVAIGAVHDDGGGDPVGLGIARFIRIADRPDTAEAAIAVADEVQRQGLGRLLLLRLIAAANERGVTRFRCEVLGSNVGMAALLAQVAPDRSVEGSSGVMSIELALPSLSPTEPPSQAPHGAVYELLRAAAQNAVEWTDAVRRLWRS